LAEDEKKRGAQDTTPGREKVQAEIDELKRRLQHMPKVTELDKDVEKARSEVIKCLRNKCVSALSVVWNEWER
jgi:MICOS complex subunit MIC19